MQELIKIIIGIAVLALGIPIGNYLAKLTHEELKSGRKWFKLIVVVSVLGAILALVLEDDVLLFSLLFIAIVTSMSLKFRNKNSKKRKKQ